MSMPPAWVDLRRYDQSHFDRGRSGWVILLWWFVQAVCFPLTLHNLHGPRCWLLRCFGAKIGQGVVIRPSARFTYPWKVEIGDYSWIGDNVEFYSLDRICVGSHAVISQGSYLCTGSHDIQDSDFRLMTAPIVIENGVWVATDCFIAPGVTIGANSVVGVRSTVLKSLPPGHLCYGTPCSPKMPRVMKERSS
ncbi:MAG: hormogonium polysaccharide biosynthesis acetyltransferase HpsU [Prochlorotrichaceae cyanobacterium]|jgi:putative colanic acid biosynthesis acetyltransferase WcaF